MNLEIALFILVIILIIVIIFCIPVIWQIWRVSKDLAVTLQTLNQSLPLIMKNMEDISTNVNNSTTLINKKIQNFADSSNRTGLLMSDIFNNIQYLAPLALKLPVFRIIKKAVAVAKGMRVFVEVLLSKEKDQKEK